MFMKNAQENILFSVVKTLFKNIQTCIFKIMKRNTGGKSAVSFNLSDLCPCCITAAC